MSKNEAIWVTVPPEPPPPPQPETESDSGPTSIHLSSPSGHAHLDSETHPKWQLATPIMATPDPVMVESLRQELVALKDWKASATQEIVERDRALADLEQELVRQQSECDANNQECMAHQRVIQELKSQLDKVNVVFCALWSREAYSDVTNNRTGTAIYFQTIILPIRSY